MIKIIFIGILIVSFGCTEAINNDVSSNSNPSDLASISNQPSVEKVPEDGNAVVGDEIEKIQEIDPKSNSEFVENPIVVAEVNNIGNQATNDFHDYVQLSKFLKKYVSASGKVNYKGIKDNPNQLKSLIAEFETNYPKTGWSKNQTLAYWINTYNLYTIKLVVDNYPVSSIKKIAAKPWDKEFIKLGGKTYSLNDIEHKMIRGRYDEPRIHFALNCASESCPVLFNKAYKAASLSFQLTSQTKRFLNDKTKNDFSNKNEIKISELFDWYKGDFTKKGTLIDFINKYRDEQLSTPAIKFMEYSWVLNE